MKIITSPILRRAAFQWWPSKTFPVSLSNLAGVEVIDLTIIIVKSLAEVNPNFKTVHFQRPFLVTKSDFSRTWRHLQVAAKMSSVRKYLHPQLTYPWKWICILASKVVEHMKVRTKPPLQSLLLTNVVVSDVWVPVILIKMFV